MSGGFLLRLGQRLYYHSLFQGLESDLYVIEKDYPERGKYFSLERKKSANDVNEKSTKE